MKRLLFYLLCSLVLTLTTCKKDQPLSGVAGTVSEFGTGQPVANATVYGIDCDGEVLGNISCFRKDSTHTDSTGYYTMTNEPDWVQAQAANYWPADQLIPVLYERELATNVSLYPYAWLKVTIRNESGAYGFGSSQLLADKLMQLQGQEYSVIKPVAGNTPFTLVFFILSDANTSMNDISNIKVLDEHNQEISIRNDASLSVLLNPVGHDTTSISIVY